MRLHIRHVTEYRYDEPVVYSIQQLRLTPHSDLNQQVIKWQLASPGHPRSQTDAHGNTVHTLVVTEPHQEISLLVEGEVDTRDAASLLPQGAGLSSLAYLAHSQLTIPDVRLDEFVGHRLLLTKCDRRETLMRLMEDVREAVVYQPEPADLTQTAAQALALGKGASKDQVHVFIASCRALGIPARYVSGYLYQEGKLAASHAWADAWLDGEAVWIGCDVTYGRFADGRQCRLAVGRDSLDASPVRGMRNGGKGESMHVELTVTSIGEQSSVVQQ